MRPLLRTGARTYACDPLPTLTDCPSRRLSPNEGSNSLKDKNHNIIILWSPLSFPPSKLGHIVHLIIQLTIFSKKWETAVRLSFQNPHLSCNSATRDLPFFLSGCRRSLTPQWGPQGVSAAVPANSVPGSGYDRQWEVSRINYILVTLVKLLVGRTTYVEQLKILLLKMYCGDFSGGAVVKNLPANAGDTGSSPGPGRSHMLRSN